MAFFLLTWQCTLSLNSQKRHGKLLLSARKIERRLKARFVAAEGGLRPELLLRPWTTLVGDVEVRPERRAKKEERTGIEVDRRA